MKTMFTLMAILAIAGLAFAAADPDPDGMGVYLDSDGINLCLTTAAPYATPTMYLMITNMSATQMKAWEATVGLNTNFAVPTFLGSWALVGAGIDAGTPEDANHTKVFAVGYGTAQYPDANGNMVLATRGLIVDAPTSWVNATVSPYPNSQSFGDAPGYAPDVGLAVPCQVPNGSYTIPQTFVNGDCAAVATQPMSWGQVKSLY